MGPFIVKVNIKRNNILDEKNNNIYPQQFEMQPCQFFFVLRHGVIDIGSSHGSYISGIWNTKFQFLWFKETNKQTNEKKNRLRKVY